MIGRARIDGLPWLGALFGVVWMPPQVRREVLPNRGHPHVRGLRVAGTAALIGMAKQRGLIGSARDVFVRLHSSDVRLSAQVIATVLARVGE